MAVIAAPSAAVCDGRLSSLIFISIVRRIPLVRLAVLLGCCIIVFHRAFSGFQAHKPWALNPVARIERQCKSPEYATLVAGATFNKEPKICLTTLTDEKRKAIQTRLFGWRNFDGMLQKTWENKINYAKKHGYYLFDESEQLDRSRPPSWSKIRAVQRLLKEENCTWVFWLDADTVVMNSSKRVEDFLPSDPNLDLLLSRDDGGGYNAGVWLIHNTPWGLNFLQEWWDMKSFVKPTGLAKSGDNDALKYKMKRMDMADFEAHVSVPPRCTFNSFVHVVPPSSLDHAMAMVKESAEYLSEDIYHKGDFIAHVAGRDNKANIVEMLLQLAT